MKGGRKNLKKAAEEQRVIALENGQSIMQVLSLRGSNIIEVMDGKGEKSLALFPAKFQRSMWIKRGSYVVVDESGKEEAIESGSKVACIVSQVLFHDQVRSLQKSPGWPEIFKSTAMEDYQGNGSHPRLTAQEEEAEHESSDDDGLPPLEANLNRIKPQELQTDAQSSSESDG